MKTQPKKNSTICITAGNRGELVATGDGTAQVVITAEVSDNNGNGLGDVDKFLHAALRVCEAALQHFDVEQHAPE